MKGIFLILQVLVMTPAILLDALRHSFLKIEMIKVLIFDECHNARGKHPYACIMTVNHIYTLVIYKLAEYGLNINNISPLA